MRTVAVMFINCPVALLCVLQTVSPALGSKCVSLLSRGRENLREWEGRVQLQAPLEFHAMVSRADTKREGRSLGEFRAMQEHSIDKGRAGPTGNKGWI